jgi:hypothetical protein
MRSREGAEVVRHSAGRGGARSRHGKTLEVPVQVPNLADTALEVKHGCLTTRQRDAQRNEARAPALLKLKAVPGGTPRQERLAFATPVRESPRAPASTVRVSSPGYPVVFAPLAGPLPGSSTVRGPGPYCLTTGRRAANWRSIRRCLSHRASVDSRVTSAPKGAGWLSQALNANN